MHKVLAGLAFLLSACAAGASSDDTASADIEFEQIDENVWLHISYKDVAPWGKVRSNGMIVRSETGITLVDTAWDDAQASEILNWVETTHGAPVNAAVFTHAHDDKMGGVNALHEKGIATYAHPQSNVLAPKNGLTPAAFSLVVEEDGTLILPAGADPAHLAGVEVYYPGPGHTEDNIVVYAKGTDILFGGCLIRPRGTQSLGNTADATISHWYIAAEKVGARYPTASVVIPSHGGPSGRNLLTLTAELARAADTKRK